jgi:hypothetical protein
VDCDLLRAHAAELEVLTDAERQLLTEWLDRAIDARSAIGTQDAPVQR